MSWNSATQAGIASLIIADTRNITSGNGTAASLSFILRGGSASVNNLFGNGASGSAAGYDIAPVDDLGAIAFDQKFIIGTAVTNSNLYYYLDRTVVTGPTSPYDGTWSDPFY
ncbi:MAG: hypothetical protein N2691_02070 [Patescibacteria group bacterium]|nr:hypothetical protein [Patescibacteria group bacterium]